MNNANLTKYLPLFTSVYEADYALALIDAQGRITTSCSNQTSTDSHAIAEFFESKRFRGNPSDSPIELRSLGDSSHLIFKKVFLGSAQDIFVFVIQVVHSAHANQLEWRSLLTNLTEAVSSLLVQDSVQTSAMDGLLDDITCRYEELNLFYSIDDQKYRPGQDDEESALKEVLYKLVRATQIDCAGLIIPDENRSIVICHPQSAGTFDGSKLAATLQDEEMMAKIGASQNPLVINQKKDCEGLIPNIEFTQKLLLFPIFTKFGQIHGLFFCAKSTHEADFTNSDRKLCATVAGQTNKILQYNNDPLTGLLNRRGFCKSVVNKRVADPDKREHDVLVILNLDRFQIINQTFGQSSGDQLLSQIATLIQNVIRRCDSAARISGDEFAILFKDCNLPNAENRANDLREQLESFRFSCQGKVVHVTASIGLVEFADQFESIDQALQAGDIVKQLAKRSTSRAIRVYRPEDFDLVKYEATIDWVNKIEDALSNDRFRLYRQAIAPVKAPRAPFEHFEILLRLEDKNGKIIFPDTFIPAAEQFDLMPKIDRWVIRHSIRLLQSCEANVGVSINLSGQSLSDDTLGDFLNREILESSIDPQRLCFEVTETIAIANLSQALNLISTIKKLGCTFSLDDFGTGMSSFGYLKTLPIDYLKIDGAFIKRIVDDPIDQTMVDSINKIAHQMNLKTVAEFVENDEIIQFLDSIGVDYAQGYGIHKPEPFLVSQPVAEPLVT